MKRSLPYLTAALLGAAVCALTAPALGDELPKKSCIVEDICLHTEETDNRVSIVAKNSGTFAYRVFFSFTGDHVTPAKREINIPLEAGEQRELVGFVPEENSAWGYRWRSNAHPSPDLKAHDANVLYRLPFDLEQNYPVSQGPNGAHTHKGKSRNAIDWAMPEGTPVLAAREGVVIDLQERFTEGGASPAYKLKGNYVRIRHPDGTDGFYGHLKHNGVLVEKGDKIKRGQVIALSGNTGWSTGPHLHFHVAVATEEGESYETIPIHFRQQLTFLE